MVHMLSSLRRYSYFISMRNQTLLFGHLRRGIIPQGDKSERHIIPTTKGFVLVIHNEHAMFPVGYLLEANYLCVQTIETISLDRATIDGECTNKRRYHDVGEPDDPLSKV